MVSDATAQKLEEMRNTIDRARDALLNEQPERAITEIEGLAEGTGCELCEAVENHLTAGIMYVTQAPRDRRQSAVDVVLEDMTHYVQLLDSELSDITEYGG